MNEAARGLAGEQEESEAMFSLEWTHHPNEAPPMRRLLFDLPRRSRTARYAFAGILAALAVLVRWCLTPLVGTGFQYLTVFPAVILVTALVGQGPGLLAAIFAVLSIEHWLVPPLGIELSSGVLVRASFVFLPAALLGRVHAKLRAARRTAETKAAEYERFRHIGRISSEIVWVTNARGEAVEDSPSWRAFTGLTVESGFGWGWSEAIHPDDRSRVTEEWKQAVAGGSPWSTEFRLIHHSGEYRNVLCRTAPVLHADGRVREWVGMYVDVTARKQAEANQVLLGAVLQALNSTDELQPAMAETLGLIRTADGFDAVGLRLRQGEDAPYYESDGFSTDFLREENFLCQRDGRGEVVRDAEGRRVLECTCGLVLSGQTDPSMDCFTDGGSFWTNASSELLALPREDDPRSNPRNRCIHLGYESVGLFPIRAGQEILGLLQLNDRRPGRFTAELVSFYETLAHNLGLALHRISVEDALRRSEERLRRAQEIAHLGSWELDLLENRFTWSDEVYRIFGRKPGESKATYEGFLEAVHPDDRRAVARAYLASLRENRDSYEIEHRVIRRDTGEVRVVHEKCEHFRDGAGRVVKSVGMVHDITERQALADSLRRRESTLSQAGKMAQLGAWEIDLSSGGELENAPLRWSSEAYRIFGYEPAEVPVTRALFFERVHPEDRERVRQAVVEAISRRAPYSVEHRIVRPNGTERIVLEHAEITVDELGRPTRVIGAVQDITERKKAEHALRKALEAADAASRAKSDFLARMSHELRTPMNGIMGMTELSLMEPELPQRAREFLGMAKESARSLLEIINDMLDIARIEAGRAGLAEKPFDVRESVGELIAPLRHAAERKGVRLDYRPSGDLPPTIVGDEGRLRQVLTNLVSNAVKFTERGDISVTVESDPTDPSDRSDRIDRARLLFAVRDTGIGIPPENLSTVFDSFSWATRSTHAKYGGTGLGLSISRQLVELMGGRIWAESEPDRGSLFQFTAAFGLPETTWSRAAPKDFQATPTSSLRVLVAEDDPLNQIFAREFLRRLGHEVVLASDGEEAAAVLTRERFDVVLMDVQMPGLTGDELTKRIRAGIVENCPSDVPVIALTAHALKGDRERFLAAGMDDYVSKPIAPEAVGQLLAEVAARRRG